MMWCISIPMAHGVSFCSMQQSVVERKSSCMAIQPWGFWKFLYRSNFFCALVWEVFGSHVPKGRLCDHTIWVFQTPDSVLWGDHTDYCGLQWDWFGKYKKDPKKEEVFRKHFNIQEGQKVVICAGLYFKRKGIEDFVEVARRMPDVRFIWLGSINKWIIPRKIRRIVEKDSS